MKTEYVIDPSASGSLQTLSATDVVGTNPVTLTDANGQPLTRNGDNSDYYTQEFKNGSNNDMAVDGSMTPVLFKVQPSVNILASIRFIKINLICASKINVSAFGYGSGLTNGVQLVKLINDAEDYSLIPYRWKANRDLLSFEPNRCQVIEGADGATTGEIIMSIDLIELLGGVLRLDGIDLHGLGFIISDDLSGITGFRAHVVGWSRLMS